MPVRVNIPIRLSMQADRLSGRLGEVGDAVEAAVERALASSRRVVLEPRSGCVAADLRRPTFRWTGRAHEIAPPVRTALEACIFEAIDAAANRVGVLTYARGAGSAAEVLPDEVFEPIDRDRFDEALGLYEIPSYDDGKGKKKIVGVSSIQRKEKESRHNWTTVTQITVESKIIGRGRGKALTSDGHTLSIHIEVNNLNVGRFVGQAWRSSTGKEGEPDWDSWTRVHLESKNANRFVYLLPPGVTLGQTVTYVVEPTVKEIWQEIQALPKHIQEFLINPKYRRAVKKKDYERALRIGKKLENAGISPDELYEYMKAAGEARSYSEKDIDAFLSGRPIKQAERKQNIVEREKAEVELLGHEALYQRYRDLLSMLKTFAAIGMGANPALIKMRDELDADLIKAGFHGPPAGIAAFEKFIRDYEKAFERETLAIAFDVLLEYEHLLHRELERFEPGATGKGSAAEILESLGKVREKAQALYEQARREIAEAKRLAAPRRGIKGERWEGDIAAAETFRREAAKHEEEAKKLVVDAVPGRTIVGWQDFPREKLLRRTTPEDVRYEVAWFITVHEAAIKRARNLLKEKPSRIYELDNLLAVSYVRQDIKKGSIYDLIIRSRISQIESDKTTKEVLLGIITIALAIVSFGGGTFGLLAAGAAFGISTVQAAGAIEEYDTKTTLYLAQLLKEEPSAAWAILAVIAAGLDATAVVKALEMVLPAARTFNTSGDLIELKTSLANVEERVRAKVMKAADQVRLAEQQLKKATGEIKSIIRSPLEFILRPTTSGIYASNVLFNLGEAGSKLLAITYYYIKSLVLKSPRRFLEHLVKEGVYESVASISKAEREVFEQMFREATALSDAGQLPYGKQIYEQLSERARAEFPAEFVDRFVAQGKAVGKSNNELIETLESEAQRRKLLEGAGEEKILDPEELHDVRSRPDLLNITEYDPTIGDSARLGENLAKSNRPKPGAGYQAHHIIPSNEAPQELRDLLMRHRLDINGEFNGIWLPTGRRTPNLSAEFKHEFLTGSEHYFARLRAILIKDPPLTKEQVIDKLRKIAAYLDEGKLPPPKL